MPLESVTFQEATDIKFEFKLETMDKHPFAHTHIAKFSGTYRPGSTGRPDACFIHGMTETALRIWIPEALILDLTELSYRWGDEMDWVIGVGEDRCMHRAVVGSEKCLPALGTLIHGEGSTRSATDEENIFDDMEPAWSYVHQEGKPKGWRDDG